MVSVTFGKCPILCYLSLKTIFENVFISHQAGKVKRYLTLNYDGGNFL